MRNIYVVLLTLLLASAAHAEVKINKNMDLCKGATQMSERRHGISPNLLRAISLTESGRWLEEEKANIAWPWTVSSGGPGQYFTTKGQAIRHVQALQAQGVENIDVGCMQINLRYHPNAFKDLNEAFDPYKNAEYAAKFLLSHFEQTKSWHEAAGRYHSQEPTKNMYYREKVLSYWSYANQEENEERRIATVVKREEPEMRPVVYDKQRVAMLNDSFRDRMNRQREALNKAERISSQLQQYREARYGQVLAAKSQALREKKNKKLLTTRTTPERSLNKFDFSKRRANQLETWRNTVANPELVAQANSVNTGSLSGTTQPKTLLD